LVLDEQGVEGEFVADENLRSEIRIFVIH
jgi:hypothetical protein